MLSIWGFACGADLQTDFHGRINRNHMSTSSKGDSLINVPELGDYIRRKRESEKLSLRTAAKLSGVGAATLNRIENRGGVPDTQTLARLAKWLNIPFERVMT